MAPAGAGLAAQVFMFLFATAVSYIASKAFGPKMPKIGGEDEQIGINVPACSTTAPVPVVYGDRVVAGCDIYRSQSGSQNEYLWVVQTLSEGEINGIVVDGDVQIWLDGELIKEYQPGGTIYEKYHPGGSTNYVNYWFHNGSSTQTYDTNLNAVDSNWTDNLRNTAYIVWKFRFDVDMWSGLPARKIRIKGKRCYDLRTSTTTWTDNPVVCFYDYYTNEEYGAAMDSARVDTTTWTTAANYCDTKGWSYNGLINTGGTSISSTIDRFLPHFRGIIQWSEAKFYLLAQDLNEETSVVTITDDDIIQDENGEISVSIHEPSRFDTPKVLQVHYIDPNKNWVRDSVQVGQVESGEESTTQEITLNGCTDRETAIRMGYSMLERMQLNRSLSTVLKDHCAVLNPGDICTFDSDNMGISNQKMRVISIDHSEAGHVSVNLQWESTDIYDDDFDTNIDSAYTCSLPDPNSISVLDSSSLGETEIIDKMRTVTRLDINFTPDPDDVWFKHCEIWVAVKDTTPSTSEYEHAFNSSSSTFITGARQGEHYWVRLRTVNVWGKKSALSGVSTLDRTILGEDGPPSNLPYLQITPGDGQITLQSEVSSDPDVEKYEFRLGSVFDTGVFLAAFRNPNCPLPNIKPGTHHFSCNTLSTNGEYGLVPVSASTQIFVPAGWTFDDDEDYDYSTGTHDNTEQYSYIGDYYLRRQATPTLTGTWTSPEYDTGAADNYYVYVDCSILVIGGSKTWSDLDADTEDWDSMDTDTDAWDDVFDYTFTAPTVNMTIQYRNSIHDDWSDDDSIQRAEIFAGVVYGRYFRLVIEITDPASDKHTLVSESTLNFYSVS